MSVSTGAFPSSLVPIRVSWVVWVWERQTSHFCYCNLTWWELRLNSNIRSDVCEWNSRLTKAGVCEEHLLYSTLRILELRKISIRRVVCGGGRRGVCVCVGRKRGVWSRLGVQEVKTTDPWQTRANFGESSGNVVSYIVKCRAGILLINIFSQ